MVIIPYSPFSLHWIPWGSLPSVWGCNNIESVTSKRSKGGALTSRWATRGSSVEGCPGRDHSSSRKWHSQRPKEQEDGEDMSEWQMVCAW